MSSVKEKLQAYGIDKLSPNETVHLLTGIKMEELEAYTTYSDIFKAVDYLKCTELQRNKLQTLINICGDSRKEHAQKAKVRNPWEIYKYYNDDMRYDQQEKLKAVLLNTKNEIITDVDIFVGTLNESLVHPREVFQQAVKYHAFAMIILHNHPSGYSSPSEADYTVTERLTQCGEMMGIHVLDHIVVGDGEYYSFKENGNM